MSLENKAKTAPKKKAVRLERLTTDPMTFQHRIVQLDNAHVEALAGEVRKGEPLDRLTVWEDPEGRLVVVDGHHRIEAYQRAEWNKPIPVTIHVGTEAAAQFLAISDNGKHRLPMSQDEKSNWAWKMVSEHPELSARDVAKGPVSLRQVKNMRATKKRLEEVGKALPETWVGARMLDRNGDCEWTEEERDEARERLRAKLLEAIRTPLAMAAERDANTALEVIETILGEGRFESAADSLGYRKMTEAEIEGQLADMDF